MEVIVNCGVKSPDSILAETIIDLTDGSLEIGDLLVKEATVVSLAVEDIDFNVLDESKDSNTLVVSNTKDISWGDGVSMVEEVGIETNFKDSGSLIKKSLAGVDALLNSLAVNCCSLLVDF